MAAYGLYTHIASNKFRSMLLLAGLFVLIYVMVYAGALIGDAVFTSGASADYYLAAAARDLVTAFPYATAAAVLWIVIAYFFHQSIVAAVTGGENVTAQQAARCRPRHLGPVEGAQRSGDRGGAGPRTHPHPQWRRATDGDRGDHRRRGRLLRRAVLPDVHQSELELERRIGVVIFVFILVVVIFIVFLRSRQQGFGRR